MRRRIILKGPDHLWIGMHSFAIQLILFMGHPSNVLFACSISHSMTERGHWHKCCSYDRWPRYETVPIPHLAVAGGGSGRRIRGKTKECDQ
jgi:hypothetical protein